MNLKNKFCTKPFTYLEVGSLRDGRVPCFSCCPQLVPDEVGDLNKQTIEEVWNSEVFQNIRSSIHDGSFRFCKKEDCPEIQSNQLPDKREIEDKRLWDVIKEKKTNLDFGPEVLNLDYDQSCNLACPSCRIDYINHNNDIEQQEVINGVALKLKDQALESCKTIIFCSSGDPFASKHFREFLGELNFELYPDLKVQIVSNGVLLTEKVWNNYKNIHSHVGLVCISLDAGREPTYEITRKGGNWKVLQENLKFLGKLRSENKFEKLRLDFVVQDYNFREMPDLVDIGKQVGADEVFFQKIVDWNTYSKPEFKKRLIYNSSHPEYSEFLKVIEDKRLKDPIVNPGNFGGLLKGSNKRIPFNLKNAIKHTLIKKWRSLALMLSK